MIQKLSRRVVADASVGGCKLLDATLTEDAATGLLVNQTYALIAANCILCPAQAAVQTIRRNVQRNTRFHLLACLVVTWPRQLIFEFRFKLAGALRYFEI